MATLTIGKLALASGISIETIRFYEHKGLIEPPARRASGYRLYGESDITRIKFIKTAKELGFSLAEIKDLLELRIAPGSNAGDIKKRALIKIKDVTEKIENLKRIKRTLAKITDQCCGEGPLSTCPILRAFDSGSAAVQKKARKQ